MLSEYPETTFVSRGKVLHECPTHNMGPATHQRSSYDVMIVKMREITVLASSLSQKNMPYLKGDTLTAGSRLVAPEEGKRPNLEDNHDQLFLPQEDLRVFSIGDVVHLVSSGDEHVAGTLGGPNHGHTLDQQLRSHLRREGVK